MTAKGNVSPQERVARRLDGTGAEVLRWNFRNAFPTKWSAPQFSARANDVAIQSLELVA